MRQDAQKRAGEIADRLFELVRLGGPALDDKTDAGQSVRQVRCDVATDMSACIVEAGPERRIDGNLKKQRTARTQHARQLGQHRLVVGNVFQDFKGTDDIEGVVAKRQRTGGTNAMTTV